jgi:ribosomal protein L11 methylase PrmA
MSLRGFIGIIDSLEGAVRRLAWKPAGTEWADYYDFTNYSDDALGEKGRLVDELLRLCAPRAVWDLGANTGLFSRIAARGGIPTIAFDIDPAAVERNYRECRQAGEEFLLPLVLDLTNPSPALGWAHAERSSLADRGPTDAVLALALIHHLAISNNVPLPQLARFFSRLCRSLIIEFVPKSDTQVQRLLSTREDVFPNYHEQGFAEAFGESFVIVKRAPIPNTERTLYLMRRRDGDR